MRVAECGYGHLYSRIFRIFRKLVRCGSCGRGEININHATVAERSAMVAERHTVIHRQNHRHAGCAKCKPRTCTLHKLEGSRGKPLELVKTLIAFSPIVNFPAQGSQNPNDSHFSHIPKPT